MPCVTQSQSEAWDIIREGRNGGGRRAAANAVTKPGAISGGQSGVHGLFRAALALLVSVSISCSLTPGFVRGLLPSYNSWMHGQNRLPV